MLNEVKHPGALHHGTLRYSVAQGDGNSAPHHEMRLAFLLKLTPPSHRLQYTQIRRAGARPDD